MIQKAQTIANDNKKQRLSLREKVRERYIRMHTADINLRWFQRSHSQIAGD